MAFFSSRLSDGDQIETEMRSGRRNNISKPLLSASSMRSDVLIIEDKVDSESGRCSNERKLV